MLAARCRLVALCLAVVAFCLTAALKAQAAASEEDDEVPTVHGLAIYDDPELPPDFSHFPYVDPDAPKGGSMIRDAVGGSFDSTNPFIVRGTAATGISQIYDTLLEENPDEPFSAYGLLAEGIRLDPDRHWIEFDLRPEARFHDDEPVTAEDVVYSFELLMEEGNPFYRGYYSAVDTVKALDKHTVRFEFSDNESRELPLIVGQLPILPKHYWEARDFSVPTLARHPGSGPYRIANVEPGRSIIYQRVSDYWGADLPVNRGRHNIDRLVYDYYRDRDVAMEAFKAGNVDLRIDARAATWATGYDFPAYHEGYIERLAVPDGQPAPMQAYAFNLRKNKFEDVRVREAFNLAFDFPWLNANIFYDTYKRTESFFQNSEMAAEGLPGDDELELLEPFRDELPERVFDAPLPIDHPENLRDRLRMAYDLLLEAGYEVHDDILVDSETGRPLTVEVLLFDTGMERVVQPLLRNLSRLGVQGSIRIVDVNQYLNRLRNFDFDLTVAQFPQSNSPGNEQREYWTSDYAEQPQARNIMGLKNPVVDALVEKLIRADSREELNASTRALDRVLRFGFYLIPHYHSGETRYAMWKKFAYPDFPEYGTDLASWWVDPDREADILRRQRRR